MLDELKDKVLEVQHSTLTWVLQTAMPLSDQFRLFLNGNEILSSKSDYKHVVSMTLKDIPEKRLASLNESTNDGWYKDGNKLKSKKFIEGIYGDVFMTEQLLSGGKSEDIGRSHGFFIKVRGRVVNENDALFGLKALTHGRFMRFHAIIHADDLDDLLKHQRDIRNIISNVIFSKNVEGDF